jgi:hypothetical protein
MLEFGVAESNGSIAHSAEHLAVNRKVRGSIPRGAVHFSRYEFITCIRIKKYHPLETCLPTLLLLQMLLLLPLLLRLLLPLPLLLLPVVSCPVSQISFLLNPLSPNLPSPNLPSPNLRARATSAATYMTLRNKPVVAAPDATGRIVRTAERTIARINHLPRVLIGIPFTKKFQYAVVRSNGKRSPR